MMRLLLVVMSLLFSGPSFAACSDSVLDEARIVEAIGPQDHVWRFEADGLKTFIESLQRIGFLVGELPVSVDAIYVTREGDDPPTLTIFYLRDHCILYVQAMRRDAFERILPQ